MSESVNAFTVYSSLELQINEFVNQLNKASQLLDSTLQNMSSAVSSLNIQPVEISTEAHTGAVQDIENAVSGINVHPVLLNTESNLGAVSEIESSVSGMVVSPVVVDTEPNFSGVNEIENAVSGVNVSPIAIQTEANLSGISELESAISSINVPTITVHTETEPLAPVTVPAPDDRNFIQKIKDSFSNLKNAVKSVPTDIALKFTEMEVKVKNTVSSIPSNIAGKFKEMGTNIANNLKSLPSNVATKFSEMKTLATGKIKELPEKISEVIKSVPSKIGAGLKTIGTNISEAFKSGVEKAKNALKELPEKASEALKNTGEKLKSIAETVAKAGTVAISAVSAGVVAFGKSAVETGANFDKSMSQVAATMGKSNEEIADLRDFAQEMGRTTAFSATESADALNYMALAGYDAETSMAMLPNVLNLASAGGMELALASDMITDSQSALGLSLDETTQLVDKMASASANSNTSVSQLGEAILTVGGTAKKLKGGTTELATVLGILADNGIKGSEGGTALRNMLNSLISPTEDATKMLENMGVSLYDEAGNMRSLNDVFIDLRKGMDGLATQAEKDQVLTTIFNARDLKSAEALIANVGDRFNELSTEIDNCSGAADAMAKTQLDNLAGDVTLFQSALEGAKIAVSDQLTPALRDFVKMGTDGLSSVTDAFSTGVKEGGLEKGFDNAVTALQPYIDKLINKVLSAIPEVVSIATKLIGILGQAIIKNIPKLAQNAVLLIRQFIENIAKNAPLAIKSFSQMLVKIKGWFISNSKNLISAGMELVKSVSQGISENLPDMMKSVKEIITFIMESISKNLPVLLDSGLKIITALGQGIITNLPDIISSAKKIISSITETISKNLPEFLDSTLKIIGAIGEGIVTNLPFLINSALEIVRTLAEYLSENLPEMIPAIIDVVLQIVETLTDPKTLSDLIDAGLAIIIGLADGIIDSLPVLLERLPAIVQNVVDVIVDNVPKLLDAAIEIIAKLGEYLIDPENLVAILDAGLEIIVSLIDGVKRVLWKLGKMAEDMIQAIADTLGLGEYREWGMDMIDNMLDGAREKLDEWNNFWEDVGMTVYDLLHHSTPEKGPLKDDDKWGGDLMDNLINGIRSKENELSATVENVAENIGKPFENPMTVGTEINTDVNSDNLKFPDISGAGFMENLITGIKSKENELSDTLKDVAENIRNTFNKPISINTEITTDSNLNRLKFPDISTVSENIYTVRSENVPEYRTETESPVIVENLNITLDSGFKISSDYDTEKFINKIAERLQARQTRITRGTGGVIF